MPKVVKVGILMEIVATASAKGLCRPVRIEIVERETRAAKNYSPVPDAVNGGCKSRDHITFHRESNHSIGDDGDR